MKPPSQPMKPLALTLRELRSSKPIDRDQTVIVPTLGRPSLEHTLGSLLEGTTWPSRLIIIDQGSESRIEQWLSQVGQAGLTIEHVKRERRGVAAARNAGIELTDTRFLCFIDDDCLADPTWLETMSANLTQAKAEIVTGQIRPVGSRPVSSSITETTPRVFTRPRLLYDILFPGNMGTSKEVFSRVGPFDEHPSVMYAEDNDWSHRALSLGLAISYVPEVIVHHLDWRSDEQLIDTYRNYARSQGAFYGKHLRRGDLRMLLRMSIGMTRAARRIVAGWVSGNDLAVRNGKATISAMLPGIVIGLRRRD